jgi:hypothetical protein
MKCGDRQLAVHGKPQRVAVMDSYERRTHKSRLACSPNHMLQKTNPSAFHFKQATQRDSTNTDASALLTVFHSAHASYVRPLAAKSLFPI